MSPLASTEKCHKAEEYLKYPLADIRLNLPTLVNISSEISAGTRSTSILSMASSQTTIPLGESSYDMIQRSNENIVEEEDFDDSAGSLASVDELESLTGTDFSINTQSVDSNADSVDIPVYVGLDQDHESSADIASSTATALASQSAHSIEFDEVDMIDTEHVTVSRTIRHFDESEAVLILELFGLQQAPTQLITTLKETLAKSRLAIDESFQVLYVGDPSAKNDIVGKIASALAAPLAGTNANQIHLRSSRFSVIPISDFGSRQIPAIELVDSFGIQLVVDHCTTARTTKAKDSADTLHLQLNNSAWISSKYDGNRFSLVSPSSWRLPHIAILLWAETDSTDEKRSLHYTRAFLARHDIPCISISRNGSFDQQISDYISPDPHSIHMCLEVRNTAGQENRILGRFPVELSTFLSLDSRQMNRNLAFLTGQQQQPNRQDLKSNHNKGLKLPIQQASHTEMMPRFLSLKYRHPGWQQSLLSIAVAIISLTSLIFLLANTETGRNHAQLAKQSDSIKGVASVSTCSTLRAHDAIRLTSTQEIVSISTSTTAEAQTISSETRALAGPMADLASLLSDPTAKSLDKSDRFELHIIGDSHMVLKPSRHFGNLRRPPPLFVKATRGGSLIPVDYSKLFDGVYALHLAPEDAHSQIDILVWTESRPVIKETFQLDFGTPWLKIASWRNAATKLSSQVQKDLVQAKGSLSTSLSHISTDFLAVYSRASVQARVARRRLAKIQLLDIQKCLPFQDWAARHVEPSVKALRGMITKDLTVYRAKMTSMVADGNARIYKMVLWAYLTGPLRDLHFVHPRDTVSEARRHARILWAWHISRYNEKNEHWKEPRKDSNRRTHKGAKRWTR